MMEQAARDAGQLCSSEIWQRVDTVLVVRTQSRNLELPGEEIARRLGIAAPHIRVPGIGGEVPQHFVNQAAGMLGRGEAKAVLICGAETYYPRSANAVRGEDALIQGIPDDYAADDAVGSGELEQRHRLTLPIHGFPLFENALWAQSAERIVTAAPDNRPICFPYTKRMVSQVMADLGAAIVMTTERDAAKFSGGGAKPVYFLGGAFARDRQRFMIDKASFTRSPALSTIIEKIEARSAKRIADLEGFDLYSCFPCAVNVARGQLGLGDDDPRPLIQTGGLGFFGGPGSNYALHGIDRVFKRT